MDWKKVLPNCWWSIWTTKLWIQVVRKVNLVVIDNQTTVIWNTGLLSDWSVLGWVIRRREVGHSLLHRGIAFQCIMGCGQTQDWKQYLCSYYKRGQHIVIVTDHIHSTREGNVFTGVCHSVRQGREGAGSPWTWPPFHGPGTVDPAAPTSRTKNCWPEEFVKLCHGFVLQLRNENRMELKWRNWRRVDVCTIQGRNA